MTDFEAEYERLRDYAAKGEAKQILEKVSSFNLDVNKPNSRGWVPLHFSARFGQKETTVALIELGASVQVQDKEGKTPLDLATFWGHDEVAGLLKESQKEPEGDVMRKEFVSFFAGNPLNRMSDKRKDLDWVQKHKTDFSSKFLVLSGSKVLFNSRGKKNSLSLLSFSDLQEIFKKDPLTVFLGYDEAKEIAYFALDLSSISPSEEEREKLEKTLEMKPEETSEKSLESQIRSFKMIRPAAFLLENHFEAALISQARSILDWNLRYKYCSTCGGKTKGEEGGYKRHCENQECLSNQGIQNTSYPRTDPVVISLVLSHDRKRCLLGRSKNFPPGMYSCLAGFMEPGESIEEAARREVYEESGIKLEKVNYHSSQPWPFPSQLMIGCYGVAFKNQETVRVDLEELEDATWFTREQVSKALSSPFSLSSSSNSPSSSLPLAIPPNYAIAHQLLKFWIDDFPNLSKI